MSDSSDTEQLGGAPVLSLLLLGRGPLLESLASSEPRAPRELVRHRTDGAIELAPTVAPLNADRGVLEQVADQVEEARNHAVTVVDLSADLRTGRLPSMTGGLEEELTAIVRALKASGTRVIVVMASTLDPDHPDETTSSALAAHEYDLMALRLSVKEGISVLDADRCVAELGGIDHLSDFVTYRASAVERLAEEFVEILDDYGFFEERPLLPQRGAEAR